MNPSESCPTGRSRALYYALDLHPRHLFQLRHSILSVRHHAPKLPIYVVVVGTLPESDQAFLHSFDVTLIPSSLEPGTSPTFLKWRALAELPPVTDLLYLDTDTLAFDDPTRFFDLAGQEDFHARPEVGCAGYKSLPYLFNVSIVTTNIVDEQLYARLAEGLDVGVVPIFNTGVMAFRNGSGRRLANSWNDFLRLERRFRYKYLPYPCKNPHLLEEMVTSFVLGGINEFSWAYLAPELCPSFVEYRGRNVANQGIILHAWSAYYAPCIFEFIGKDEAFAYEALPKTGPAEPRRRGILAKARGAGLLWGSMFMRLPRPVVAVWIRIGSIGIRRAQIKKAPVSCEPASGGGD